MAMKIAKYTFSSWLRKGIGATINETDNLGDGTPTVPERATIPIEVSATTDISANTTVVSKKFELRGPGDIMGVNGDMRVRTEPLNWITNFEPNYLPFIEFYDEDFLWRYTPARASGDLLRPWIILAVLKEAEGSKASEFTLNDKKVPATVTVNSADSLPLPTQHWAWSHVHINDGFDSSNPLEEFLKSLHNVNDPNADKIISRLVCPRKLEPNTAYHAFVIPAFETGRLGGLGQPTKDIDAQQPSYKPGDTNIEFPFYHDWYFRTGAEEDFESLVKLLEPRVMDKNVGIRDMDGSKPGFGMAEGTDIDAALQPEETKCIIGLEGALKAPSTESKPQQVDTTKPFFAELKKILNFPAELQKNTNIAEDPAVCPPIYGENHALTHEMDPANTGWLHVLNRDPRNRASSGFGTNVIQKNQDGYMARAWAQVQKILEANRKILFAAFAMNFVQAIKKNFTEKLSAEKTLIFFSPLLKKVKGSPTTLHYQLQQSTLPSASLSVAFRRIIQPRGAYFEKLKTADASFDHATVIKGLNSGTLSAAPPKKTPPGITTTNTIVNGMPNGKCLPAARVFDKYGLWVLLIFLTLVLSLALLTGNWAWGGSLALAAIAAYAAGRALRATVKGLEAVSDPGSAIAVIQETPPRGDFRFTEIDPVVPPVATSSTQVSTTTSTSSALPNATVYTEVSSFTPTAPGQDSLEAGNFRAAALELNDRLTIKAPEKIKQEFDMANAFEKLTQATDPRMVFPRKLAALVHFSFNPAWLLDPEKLVPAMAYPDFEDPMYEKLRDISSELLIPNLNLIPQNTISLLVTNPAFIESYMVGLNHEFGKELLWREYPTDTRGSYFRQFWDVKGIITNETGLSPELLTEKYKDITPLDTWQSTSQLGDHKNRNIHDKKQVVLVVRGELLKKYPNTVVYAQKAHIFKDENGTINAQKEPQIIEITTDAEMKDEIKFPLFKAEVDPDLKFLGFDLTIEQAQGADKPQTETDDWGWYFVIQQVPGEPRFGMDIAFSPEAGQPVTWNNLAWDKCTTTNGFIDAKKQLDPAFQPAERDKWGDNSAFMAYALYRQPVMIAVHAKEMLANLNQ
jgi:hypothetical protein